MPYRVDLPRPPEHAFETLIDLGALDVEHLPSGLAAILPDSVAIDTVVTATGVRDVRVTEAVGRDDGSVWLLGTPAPPEGLVLADGPAFGTGLHPTTALCLKAIEEVAAESMPARVMDVGTGSGILALAALRRGAKIAIGVDVDPAALRIAVRNARLNELTDRFLPVCGDVTAVAGSWPLVMANIRAAELMDMAPALVQRIASRGRLVLSGIPSSVVAEVERTYRDLGMAAFHLLERDGWTALTCQPSW